MNYTYKVKFKSEMTLIYNEEPTNDEIKCAALEMFDMDKVKITSIKRVD